MSSAAVARAPAIPTKPPRVRVDSIDLLRGLVMVVMALDHVRDWMSNAQFDPSDLTQTWPALFFTRWITHFCAPTFVFLAGAAAYLYGTRGRSKPEISRFLWTRGVWLIFLEVVFVHFGWYWNFDLHFIGDLQVIWAIGWSMLALSALIYLPVRWVAATGIAIVALHNTLDGVHAASLGRWGILWNFLHERATVQLGHGFTIYFAYPVLAWVGVMAAGYGFGSLLVLERTRRQRTFAWGGAAIIATFVLLRLTNWYGDPILWSPERSPVFTLMSFLHVTKYPPSLLFLLMTLGPAIAFLGVCPDAPARVWKPLITFGRVPLFSYLLHQHVAHAIAVIYAYAVYGRASWLFANPSVGVSTGGVEGSPSDWGIGLSGVYLCWLLAIVILYPACRWFAGVKQRRTDAWLSYL